MARERTPGMNAIYMFQEKMIPIKNERGVKNPKNWQKSYIFEITRNITIYIYIYSGLNEYSGFNRKTEFNLETSKIQCNAYFGSFLRTHHHKDPDMMHIMNRQGPFIHTNPSPSLWVNPYGREGSRNVSERDLTRYQRYECQWRVATNARLCQSSVTSLSTDFDNEVSLKEMSKDQPNILQVHYMQGMPGESVLESKRPPKNKQIYIEGLGRRRLSLSYSAFLVMPVVLTCNPREQ